MTAFRHAMGSSQVVCKIDALTPSQSKDFKSKIDDEYRVNMILDNLPVGMVKIREENGAPIKTYEPTLAQLTPPRVLDHES